MTDTNFERKMERHISDQRVAEMFARIDAQMEAAFGKDGVKKMAADLDHFILYGEYPA